MDFENQQEFAALRKTVREISVREVMSGHLYKDWSLMKQSISEAFRDRTKIVLLAQQLIPIVAFYADKKNYPFAVAFDRGKNAQILLKILKEL